MRVELIFQISEYYILDFMLLGEQKVKEGEWWWSPNFYNTFTPPRPPRSTLWTKLTFANKFERVWSFQRQPCWSTWIYENDKYSVFTSVTVAYCTKVYSHIYGCYILLLKATSVMLKTIDGTKVRILSAVFLAVEPSFKKMVYCLTLTNNFYLFQYSLRYI